MIHTGKYDHNQQNPKRIEKRQIRGKAEDATVTFILTCHSSPGMQGKQNEIDHSQKDRRSKGRGGLPAAAMRPKAKGNDPTDHRKEVITNTMKKGEQAIPKINRWIPNGDGIGGKSKGIQKWRH